MRVSPVQIWVSAPALSSRGWGEMAAGLVDVVRRQGRREQSKAQQARPEASPCRELAPQPGPVVDRCGQNEVEVGELGPHDQKGKLPDVTHMERKRHAPFHA